MNKLDNIASKIAKGHAQAAAVARNEVNATTIANDVAAIDKVGSVKQSQPGATEGFTGAARTVTNQPANNTASPTGFGAHVTNAIKLVNEYELAMGGTKRTSVSVIDDQQARLYNAIMMILQVEDDSDFIGGMEFLFRKFRDDKHGAFTSDRLRRRINYMRQPSGSKSLLAYSGFLDMLQIFSIVANRKPYWNRFNKAAVIQVMSKPANRMRLENYMNSISR